MYSEKNVIEYFKKKCTEYDLVEKQIYWNLSDKLLWYLLNRFALEDMRKTSKFKFLDAGGGTGRWFIKILENFKNSEGILYDISEDMTGVAKDKIKHNKLDERSDIVIGNIENMIDQRNCEYDLVINLYNVLGFLCNPEKAVSEMYRVLKKGGYLISVVPNKYHGVFFNLTQGNISASDKISKTSTGVFCDDMPEIKFFTPSGIKEIYRKNGLKNVSVYGFPVSLYPGYEETRLKGSTKKIDTLLSNKNYLKIFSIEKELILNEDASGRGNNLFVIGKK